MPSCWALGHSSGLSLPGPPASSSVRPSSPTPISWPWLEGLGRPQPIREDVLGRPPPWPRSSCRSERVRAARDCLEASLEDGPARPVGPSPPVLSDEDNLPNCSSSLSSSSTSQMETVATTLPTKSSSDIEWTLESGLQPEPGILQLWTDSDSWSEAVELRPPRVRSRGFNPPTHTPYTHCRHVCCIDPSEWF